jgi:ATP-dependent DNA ligase
LNKLIEENITQSLYSQKTFKHSIFIYQLLMSADKRQFSDFTKFPGVIDKTTGSYVFPPLFHTDGGGKTRIWAMNIRLIKGDDIKSTKSIQKQHKHDWDLLLDDTVPVKASYLDGTDIPDGTIAQVWAETGVVGGKIARHAPTYPNAKNVGRSNARNRFEQGMILARSQYLKKYENGLRPEKEFKKSSSKGSKSSSKNTKYFPMLVRKFDDEKKHLTYPLYVQPKLDGARMIVFLNKSPKKKPTFKNVVLYTRQKKDYIGFDKIRGELLPALIDMWDFESNQSIYIDGELYKHGFNLQTISGAVRNPKRDEMPEYKGIKYHIFDIFYPSNLGLEFKDRIDYLDDVFSALGSGKTTSDCVERVNTIKVKSDIEQEKLYKQFLKKKYEGVILRNASSLYLTHPTKNSMAIRSKFVLKRKMTYSDEFEVVDFEQGTKGRDKGAIMWVCKTNQATNGTNKLFSVTPKNTTYEERYKAFKEANANNKKGFNTKFKGRMMTVEYEDMSKDNVPLRAKAVGFREHI